MNILCETDRLMIRQFELSDTEFIVRLLNEPAFIRYIADKKVRSQDDAVHYLKQGPMASYERYGFGLNLVCLKSSLIPIGICGVLKRDELEYPDLGYAFLEAFCGQGYAREAAEQTLKVTVDSFSLETVFAVTLPDNVRSNQLLEKIGFRFKATVPLYGVCNNLYQYRVKPLPKGAASGLA
ncbi:Protein N-acetyltransferase, RimJ/RimL family [Oceanospirillum multiglobuliferum]|uniref:GNAT family N-acetyltransferase n=1 Tax=Oceanospirillum multiglobuliferum TaxID=64969 RepID=A0A1T4MVP6_9GAMM|nr:GNAT family N-acetyltransferase [Oceanospirillum multiglobuliferum]OPX56869.1 GNAT family N-acetyltransferase [Oceanospirillum multiglobuliferum]SJZ71129.1 Protein N-acetyltransferase, RimJ/RimL family [Oceanospirillum multiglobuliferum]